MHNHEHEPKRESNRAILAHVKQEMDKPRMSQSAREEEESQLDRAAGVENAALQSAAKQFGVGTQEST